ncbi:hypothetical protein [Rudanella lutea]|uniref:hypothetical protein n=1 Tax=Rudanella lutea TaxID=451374 RepID=UPI0012F95A1E|nr:hypothetical protein [Rudanella lutea]
MLWVGCTDKPNPAPVRCAVVSVADQLDAGGRLTDQMLRSFTYTAGQLTQLAERNTDRQLALTVEYGANGQLLRASTGSFTIAFDYTSGQAFPSRATSIQGGNPQAVYDLAYSANNKLARVFENRQVLAPNSLVRSREYLFTYDDNGNMITEKLKSTLNDRSTVEQETDFTYGTGMGPMANFSQPVLLTVASLSQYVETMPGQFWQQRILKEYKTYNARNGVRSAVRETATFTPALDGDNRLIGQEQNTVSTTSSGQTFTRRNKLTFAYQCQ